MAAKLTDEERGRRRREHDQRMAAKRREAIAKARARRRELLLIPTGLRERDRLRWWHRNRPPGY